MNPIRLLRENIHSTSRKLTAHTYTHASTSGVFFVLVFLGTVLEIRGNKESLTRSLLSCLGLLLT